jgi:hypothetical protein
MIRVVGHFEICGGHALLSKEGSTGVARARGGSYANHAGLQLRNPLSRDFDFVSIALSP